MQQIRKDSKQGIIVYLKINSAFWRGMMQKKLFSSGKHQGIAMSLSLLFLLAGLLTACSMPGGSSSGGSASSSPTTLATSSVSTSTPTPRIGLGSQPCPGAVSAPSHRERHI